MLFRFLHRGVGVGLVLVLKRGPGRAERGGAGAEPLLRRSAPQAHNDGKEGGGRKRTARKIAGGSAAGRSGN